MGMSEEIKNVLVDASGLVNYSIEIPLWAIKHILIVKYDKKSLLHSGIAKNYLRNWIETAERLGYGIYNTSLQIFHITNNDLITKIEIAKNRGEKNDR